MIRGVILFGNKMGDFTQHLRLVELRCRSVSSVMEQVGCIYRNCPRNPGSMITSRLAGFVAKCTALRDVRRW